MKRLDELFDIEYGNSFDLASLTQVERGSKHSVGFVSRVSQNNGISAIVEEMAGAKLQKAGTLTVAVGGSVMETFLQPEPYYTGYHVLVLTQKTNMTDAIKLYYCACIRANKYRYNYGRQANKTLGSIMVPDISAIPEWVASTMITSYENIASPIHHKKLYLTPEKWKSFRYDQLFEIKKGKRVTKFDMMPGDTPFLGAIDSNNGIREYAGLIALHKGNTITVNYNGSVGEAFYQEQAFWASDDINVLYPKFHLNKYIAMFLIAAIRQEKYRFNYGRKWHKERMVHSHMRLPVADDERPDWDYMENYIKTLPYSSSI